MNHGLSIAQSCLEAFVVASKVQTVNARYKCLDVSWSTAQISKEVLTTKSTLSTISPSALTEPSASTEGRLEPMTQSYDATCWNFSLFVVTPKAQTVNAQYKRPDLPGSTTEISKEVLTTKSTLSTKPRLLIESVAPHTASLPFRPWMYWDFMWLYTSNRENKISGHLSFLNSGWWIMACPFPALICPLWFKLIYLSVNRICCSTYCFFGLQPTHALGFQMVLQLKGKRTKCKWTSAILGQWIVDHGLSSLV